jgi:hypothetical protein
VTASMLAPPNHDCFAAIIIAATPAAGRSRPQHQFRTNHSLCAALHSAVHARQRIIQPPFSSVDALLHERDTV